MNHLDSTLTKLDVVGVKLYVNEADKFNFNIHFKKYLIKSPKFILNKNVINSCHRILSNIKM